MSQNKAGEYLSDLEGNKFTENAPRPPVPGEENELQSTHSSGSHKSHMSMKSHSSGKSGGSQNGEVGHSPAATPRRSNLDKSSTGGSLSCSVQGLDKCDDENAPLGFEPEGSAANSPPFTENSTPPCLKWATSLHHLLEDSDGVQLYSKFLENEAGGKHTLDFWYACQGLKKQPPSETVKINYIIKVINKKYIRGESLSCISARTRKSISDQIDGKNLLQSIFDEAQREVEEYMRNNSYRLFLNSDFYVQYVERASKSPKSSETSSGSNSVRPVSGPLPTLLEDQELSAQSFDVSALMGPPSSRYTSFTQPESKGTRRPETISGYNPYTSFRQPQSQPYYTSYATVSAVDSEIQSLSSDALTDDTMSLTDSSVDGFPTYKKHWKQRRAVSRRAQQNKEGKDAPLVIPRTDRPPKDRNIAETDPQKFASLLIERLHIVLKEREKEEKMAESLRMCESEDGDKEDFIKASNSLLLMQSIEEDNAQSILEDHCSRIWDNSSHHTPSRSPGRHSPKSKSPDRTIRKMPASANTTFPGTLTSKSQRKAKKDTCISMLSSDSGVGEEKRVHTIHHHHHHHHGTQGHGRATLEWVAQNKTMAHWRGDQMGRPHSDFSQGTKTGSSGAGSIGPVGELNDSRRRDGGRRSNSRKTSTDASSVFDSGISGVYEKEPLLPTPNPSDPNYEKVMGWMLASDSVTAPAGNHADSDRSSSHKWSHKAASSSPSPQPHKGGSSKKQQSLNSSNRSASAERSGAVPPRISHGGVQPNQPIIQDPSMPLLTPPNTMTQLEEAKRRLESEARALPVKSKSFAGVSARDKRNPTSSQSTSQNRNSPFTRVVPSGLDLQSGNVTLPTLSSSEKRSAKKSSTPVLANSSALASLPSQSMSQPASMSQSQCEETVIGIYFCGDPIPYRHTIPGTDITLGQFKQLISKKGNYRYYFKKNSDEFGSGAVFEEVGEDGLVLPLWEGKIVAKVERLD